MKGWIGVDLDGTLAQYDGWKGIEHIGEPIPAMVERVKLLLEAGETVKIFTARVSKMIAPYDSEEHEEAVAAGLIIKLWTEEVFGVQLEVTCVKDFGMIELWDDRCVQVEPNTGRRVDGKA